MKFTEAQLESAIIELLGVEGYPHVLRESKRAAEATIRKFRTTASAGNSYNLFAIA